MPNNYVKPASQAGASTDYVVRTQQLDGSGNIVSPTSSSAATTATLTNVNDTASSTTLKAAAAGRKGLIIHNDSTSALFVKYGATASASSYTVKIAADGYWEMPQPIYTGVVDGIWASDASGAARITELT